MKLSNDQITFQVRNSIEGKSRVYLKSWEDGDGSATLASVVANDFRLGSHGEGLIDAFAKLHELDKRCERATNSTSKESKAAHRRIDNALPSLDSRITALEERLAALADTLIRIEKSLADVRYESEHLTDIVGLINVAKETSDSAIDAMRQEVNLLDSKVEDLQKFNDKVVLFYDEDHHTE